MYFEASDKLMIYYVSDAQRYFAFLLLNKSDECQNNICFSIYCSFKMIFPSVLIPSLSGLTLLKNRELFYAPPGI